MAEAGRMDHRFRLRLRTAFPLEEARGYYEDLTGNRSASRHLQVKAGIAFLYKVLDKPSPGL